MVATKRSVNCGFETVANLFADLVPLRLPGGSTKGR